MRTVIVLGVLGLALGLAAQMLPRVLERDASVVAVAPARSSPSLGQPPSTSPQLRVSFAAPAVFSEEVAVTSDGEKPADHDISASEEWSAPVPYTSWNEDTAQAIERLRAAGFTVRRAREMLSREFQLRDEAIKAEYAATGTIRPLNASARSVAGQQLRNELGDEVYEKYREATGQPTRVRIGDVEPGSPAANAGVLSGDEILSYAGRRVFDLGELNAMMLQRSTGDTVPMAIVREGQPLQLYVTGGQLGISQRSVR